MTNKLPTKQENPDGFHLHYLVNKADGTPIDKDAEYIVLRVNGNSCT